MYVLEVHYFVYVCGRVGVHVSVCERVLAAYQCVCVYVSVTSVCYAWYGVCVCARIWAHICLMTKNKTAVQTGWAVELNLKYSGS